MTDDEMKHVAQALAQGGANAANLGMSGFLKEMEMWDPIMQNLMGKEKWESLTMWQRMVEIATVKEYNKRHPILGF